jgi:signal transduction histidine kinase
MKSIAKLGSKAILGLVAIVACSAMLVWISALQKTTNLATAQQEYIESSKAKTAGDMRELNNATREIYQNLRTLATLPGMASIDRHATNISDETRATFQNIYNNLATSVSVSEVYIVPIDFALEKFDPFTGKTQEPIMMFDSLILNAGADISQSERLVASDVIATAENDGKPEVEEYEYAELVKQAAWFRSNYQTRSKINALDFPMIGSPELITCDNTIFNTTGRDSDRSGIILSVPFFDKAGQLKGMISTIILSPALLKLLPNENSALISLGNSFVGMAAGAAKMTSSHDSIRAARSDNQLIYSEMIALPQFDKRSAWSVWVGHPDEKYWTSPVVENIQSAFIRNVLAIAAVTIALLTAYVLFLRNLSHVKALNKAMAANHEIELVKQAEHEASERVLALSSMNEKVLALNTDLESNIQALKQAQVEIVEKSKMAQLGQLVATVAHEIRNPLGGVRTSAFLLQRRLKDSPSEVQTALSRIDNGIARCDSIITQLLDFSRSNKPVTQVVEVDDWVTRVLQDLAGKLNSSVSLHCDFGLGQKTAEFDPDRMERVIVNLVRNAADAMVDQKTGQPFNPASAPVVSISTWQTKRGIEFKVSDNGPGIPKDVLEKIREPLFTTKSFGTGLGIPAAEKVVELHGGKLDIQSELGQGAAFSFHIPPALKSA